MPFKRERLVAPIGDLDQCRDFLCYPNLPDPEDFSEVESHGETQAPRPFGHTALEPYSPPYSDYHRLIDERMISFVERHTPAGIPPEVATLVMTDFWSGVSHREANACANYHNWAQAHPEELAALHTSDEHLWALGQAMTGHADANGLFGLLLAAPSLESVDLQVLTTPFGYRRHHLPAMREQLREAIALRGGVYDQDAPVPDDKIKLAYHRRNNGDIYAIGCTYKRRVGTILDSKNSTPDELQHLAVMERHALLLRTDRRTRFPQDIVEALNAMQRPQPDDPIVERIKEIIKHPDSHNFIVPASMMTYVYREVLHERHRGIARRLGVTARSFPTSSDDYYEI